MLLEVNKAVDRRLDRSDKFVLSVLLVSVDGDLYGSGEISLTNFVYRNIGCWPVGHEFVVKMFGSVDGLPRRSSADFGSAG